MTRLFWPQGLDPSVPFHVLIVEDGGTGLPIVHEHEIPQAVSLDAVKLRQQGVSSGYGSSWIAECWLMPDSLVQPPPITPSDAVLAVGTLAAPSAGGLQQLRARQTLRRFLAEKERGAEGP